MWGFADRCRVVELGVMIYKGVLGQSSLLPGALGQMGTSPATGSHLQHKSHSPDHPSPGSQINPLVYIATPHQVFAAKRKVIHR